MGLVTNLAAVASQVASAAQSQLRDKIQVGFSRSSSEFADNLQKRGLTEEEVLQSAGVESIEEVYGVRSVNGEIEAFSRDDLVADTDTA